MIIKENVVLRRTVWGPWHWLAFRKPERKLRDKHKLLNVRWYKCLWLLTWVVNEINLPSYNPTSSTRMTMTDTDITGAVGLDSADSLAVEINWDNIFKKNNHDNKDFVRRYTYKSTEPNVTNNEVTHVTTATILYINQKEIRVPTFRVAKIPYQFCW